MPILRSRRQTARHHGLSGLPPIWERADPETGEPREDRRTREVATGALLHGPDDRPQAPCSDVIATAVRELLAAGPDPLALVRYADASWQVQQAATSYGRNSRPVSDPLARRALTFSAGRRGSWTSSLDRGPEVSDAVRCHDDIGAVRRERACCRDPR